MINQIKQIDKIISGLNNVEVRGQTNLAMLYNAIEDLKQLRVELELTPEITIVEKGEKENASLDNEAG